MVRAYRGKSGPSLLAREASANDLLQPEKLEKLTVSGKLHRVES
jgi:hypothetical protein